MYQACLLYTSKPMNTTVISGRLVRNPGYNEVENEKGLHKIAKFVLADVYKRQDEWFSDDLRKLDDDNVYRKLQGHWIIEMSEMMATANAKSIEEIKSFLSRQKEVYKIPYETHPADRPRQCVFGGTSNARCV